MKGYLKSYILVIIMLGMFSILSIAFNEIYTPLHSFATSEVTDSNSLNTINIINWMWVWFPVGVLFSYVIYSIRKPQKEKEVWP